MTKKEALLGVLQVSVSDITLEKAMIDVDMDGEDDYDLTSMKDIDLLAIEVLQGILAAPDVSEGGYSIRYDRNFIQQRLAYLSQKHGIGSGPTVRSVNVW